VLDLGNRAARKARGLEAALVDHVTLTLEAFAPGDDRRIEARVAGVAALIVAKSHKLGERVELAPNRLSAKDALDVLRLLRASETDVLAETYGRILADERAGAVTRKALTYLRALFIEPDATALSPTPRARSCGRPSRANATRGSTSSGADSRRRSSSAGR
jgi:hypothetical protein